MNPLLLVDAYKISHVHQYPLGTEFIYSNFTARSGKRSNIKESKGVYFFGLQYVLQSGLVTIWNEEFFNKPKQQVLQEFKETVEPTLGPINTEHLEELHDLGYLPIKIKALPEGSFVPYGVPCFTIINTHPKFYWLTNALETYLSSELWQMITSTTTAVAYLENFYKYAEITGADKSFIPYQVHDFSYRGLARPIESGLAVLASGVKGTDVIPSLKLAKDYYFSEGHIGGSVPATEHSVMCAGGKEDELETYRRLIEDIYPSGIISIVSDTWDLWEVVDTILPKLKESILSREGKVVIRPDSGNPADIIAGTNSFEPKTSKHKGLIQSLWDIFGGTINEKGYKVLDSHIGAIYGEGITLDVQQDILHRLSIKGFASSNIVMGIGSYAFQYVTRDTHGIAIKSTHAVINGNHKPIFKDPKTDSDKIKKSAKGLLMVCKEGDTYTLVDDVTPKQENKGCLETVFEDGKILKHYCLEDVRATVALTLQSK